MKLYKNLKKALEERESVTALKISIKEESLPEELDHFPNLMELYLEGNCRMLPRKIPSWKKLKILSVKWPSFQGDLTPVLGLPLLENLKMIETPIKAFLLPLGHTSSPLRSLTVKDCGLTVLPEEISMLTFLQEFNLSGNDLTVLPHGFVDLRNLKRLNLDGNKFQRLPELLKKMPGLSHLSIDGNKFTEEEKEKIQREFHIWPN